MIGANVKAIPTPPPQSPVIISTDSFWGAHKWTVYLQLYPREFPYLAWIPLRQHTSIPSSIHTPVDKSVWQAHPDQPNIHIISPALFVMIIHAAMIRTLISFLLYSHLLTPSLLSYCFPFRVLVPYGCTHSPSRRLYCSQ